MSTQSDDLKKHWSITGVAIPAGVLTGLGIGFLINNIAALASQRLRPILLTTLTTLGGLLPMAYGLGGYEKMLSPMSLAFSWGLLFATIITLYIIPAIFLLLHKQK